MSIKLPDGALYYLKNWKEHFFKKDRLVIERINKCSDSQFIDVFWQLDKKILVHTPINKYSHEPIYDDAYLGQWWVFLVILIENATEFNSEEATKIRQAKKDFGLKIFEIADLAENLATQMRIIEANGEKWGLCSGSDVHPLELLNNTVKHQSNGETTYRYNNWVSKKIKEARHFDLKYFPSIPDMIDEISRQYTDDYFVLDSAKVSNQKSKIYDFWGHFFPEIERQGKLGQLPSEFMDITRKSWAEILRIVLGNDKIGEQDIGNYNIKYNIKQSSK